MPKGYKQLVYEQRCQISAYLKIGMKKSEISRELKVDKKTIGSEIKRNGGKKKYDPLVAQGKSEKRRKNAGHIRQKNKLAAKAMAIDLLKIAQWSPEQISGRLESVHQIKISHTSIYKLIRANRLNGGDWYKNLRNKGKKYNRHGKKSSGRGLIPGRIGIEHRPVEANMKSRIGDFEIDTIIGKGHKGAILSAVDRKSKLCRLALLDRNTAEAVENAACVMFELIKNDVITITSDNGKEFARHYHISTFLGAAFFFADAYCSWQRGLNEYTNRLIRQYFPKKHVFINVTKEEVLKKQELLNNRPRKCLNYQTPNEVFFRSNIFKNFVAV